MALCGFPLPLRRRIAPAKAKKGRRGKQGEEVGITGPNQRPCGISAKQKLYQFLCSRPAGADAGELVGLMLSGAGSDPELGARLVRQLIGGDPNFIFDADSAQWRLAQSDRLRVGLDEAEFTVV